MNNIQKVDSCLVISMAGIGCKKITLPCQNFKEASDMVKEYIRYNDLGGSTFKGGIILHPKKGAIANISYNGRVWEGGNILSMNRKEITNLNTNDL